jgi:uncharacterized surface protein with fasciclin (FAS1) repeats
MSCPRDQRDLNSEVSHELIRDDELITAIFETWPESIRFYLHPDHRELTNSRKRWRAEMNAKTSLRTIVLAAGLSLGAAIAAAPVMAEMTVMVGGAPMYPSKNIVENAVNSKDHTTLVAAVKAAGLVDTLASAGPFTVFAPTNEAFAKLPKGTVDTLLKPENKDKLTAVLTYHVVAGHLTAQDLADKVDEGGGKAMLKTVQGEDLTVKRSGRSHLTVTDSKGDVAQITIANVLQSNGVIHVINKVLIPG